MSFTASLDEIIQNDRTGLLAIHPSWSRVPLGQVATILNGFAFPSSRFTRETGTPLLRIRDILATTTEAFYDGDFSPAYLVHHGDLLVGMDGDFNVGLWNGSDALLNQRVCKITPDEQIYRRKFLYYVLPGYLRAINQYTSSITVKHLSSGTLAKILLPNPPVEIQDEIVSEIERQFTRLDAAVAGLKAVQIQLKAYWAAAQLAAFRGRLTISSAGSAAPAKTMLKAAEHRRDAEWQAQFGDRKVRKRKLAGVPEQVDGPIPQGWAVVSVGMVTKPILHALKAGPFGSSLKKEYYVPVGYKVYGQEQVIRGDAFFGNYYIPEERFALLRSCAVRAGDVLVSLVGTAGRVLVLPDDAPAGIINPRLIKITPDPELISPRFLKAYLEGPLAKSFFARHAHGQTMDVLNLGILQRLPILLPPREEQDEIISRLEHASSILNATERASAEAETRATLLRSSILRLAFTGELTQNESHG